MGHHHRKACPLWFSQGLWRKSVWDTTAKRHHDGFRAIVLENSCEKELEDLWNLTHPLEKHNSMIMVPLLRRKQNHLPRSYEIPVFQTQPPIQLPPSLFASLVYPLCGTMTSRKALLSYFPKGYSPASIPPLIILTPVKLASSPPCFALSFLIDKKQPSQ